MRRSMFEVNMKSENIVIKVFVCCIQVYSNYLFNKYFGLKQPSSYIRLKQVQFNNNFNYVSEHNCQLIYDYV